MGKASAAKGRPAAAARTIGQYRAFLERLAAFRVLDPACGSGNFLYLALQALKDLERRAIVEAEEMGLAYRVIHCGPQNVKGIEINQYAAELARTSIWIGNIQWLRRNGFEARKEPVLEDLDAIECRDALVTKKEDGSYEEAQWPGAEFIVGNPPFLGGQKIRGAFQADYLEGLLGSYQERVPQGADLVTYWFEKARDAIEKNNSIRVGLVATQSIRRGSSRVVLDRIQQTTEIFEAWSDEEWTIDGADVRISIICFGGLEIQRRLDGIAVSVINSDLSASSADLTHARRLSDNIGVCFQGPVKVGPFDVSGEVARKWLSQPLNPNGRPNSDVLVPTTNGNDVVKRPRGRWIIDFGDRTEAAASLFELPFEYARENVKPLRASNRDKQRRENWWRLGRSGADLKTATGRVSRFIITPRVARHRIFVWSASPMLPDTRLVAVARDDDVTMGVLHSRFHETWSLKLGGWHGVGNDPQYTPTLGFETFPFPVSLTPNIPAKDYADNPRAVAIAKAAKRLDELRNAWLNPPDLIDIVPEVVPGYPDRILPKTEAAAAELKRRTLTNLYNQRPQWLAEAHRDLDAAVAAAYGWPADISEDDALAKLLELNLARASASGPAQADADEEAPESVEQSVLGRKQFAKISAVEGIALTDDMKRTMAEFDRKKLPPAERRRAIIGRFKRAGK